MARRRGKPAHGTGDKPGLRAFMAREAAAGTSSRSALAKWRRSGGSANNEQFREFYRIAQRQLPTGLEDTPRNRRPPERAFQRWTTHTRERRYVYQIRVQVVDSRFGPSEFPYTYASDRRVSIATAERNALRQLEENERRRGGRYAQRVISAQVIGLYVMAPAGQQRAA